MTVHGIHSIVRKNLLISYRREYTAKARVGIHTNSISDCDIEFSLELTPLGTSIIRVKLTSDLDYPSLPVTNAIKEIVHSLDHNGDLP